MRDLRLIDSASFAYSDLKKKDGYITRSKGNPK